MSDSEELQRQSSPRVAGRMAGLAATASDEVLISQAMTRLGINADPALESVAGLARHTLSKARRGSQPLSALGRAKIYHLIGAPWAKSALSKLFGSRGRLWLARTQRAAKKVRAGSETEHHGC